MTKYLYLARITFQEFLAYRLNFILWRFRNFLATLILFFFWLALYGPRQELLGYQKAQILTYSLGIAFLRSLVLSSKTSRLTNQIRSGGLNRLLLKPWGTFKFWFTQDLADKTTNLLFAFFEIGLILYFFKFSFYFPQNLLTYLPFIFLCLLSVLLFFLIDFWLSTFTFWVDQPWAPRWLFGVIFLYFLSGASFPLDVLPPAVLKIASFTPFPYLIYFPLKVWLEQVTLLQTIKVILITLFWLIAFWFIVRKTWEKGLKTYTAYGD